jgi:hypothetical protein
MRTPDEVMYALWKSKKYSWTQREIAELFDVTVSTVCRRIEPERWRRWEIVMTPHELRELYERLGSIRRVADALWCSVGTIHKKMVEYGIPRNRPCVHNNFYSERRQKQGVSGYYEKKF